MFNLFFATSRTNCFVAVTLLLAATPPLPIQQHEEPAYGIIVMAHGGDHEWNQRITEAVADAGATVPLRIAFGMADRASLEASVAALEDEGVRNIVVVRLFVSGESFLQQTEYLLGLDAAVPDFLYDSSRVGGMRPVADPEAVPPVEHDSVITISAQGLVDAELSGRILAERAISLSLQPENETVLVIAHGMGNQLSNERLLTSLRERVETIGAAAPFRAVEVVTLREDWEEERVLAEARIRDIVAQGSENGRVIVIPFRIAGFGPYAEVLAGFDYTADGTGLLPHPGMSEWILRTAHDAACREGWIVADCDPPISRRSR